MSYRQVFAQDRVFLVLALIGDAQALVFLLERFERFDQLGLFHACTLAGAAAISNLFGAFFPRRLSSYDISYLMRGGIPGARFTCKLPLLVKGFKDPCYITAYFDVPIKGKE